MSKRSERVRGPYIDPDEYQKLSNLAENKEMTIQDALDELLNVTLNDSGQITVNPVSAKFNN